VGHFYFLFFFALADENALLIGVLIEQFGVINYDGNQLGFCMGMTDTPYVITTKVHPDTPLANDENCIQGQVASVLIALNFILSEEK
jgi:hypothetical protein